MKLTSRCFPLGYYTGEILTEVEVRRRRNYLVFYACLMCSLRANNIEVD